MGVFSWITSDTKQPIWIYSFQFRVYLVSPTGKYWAEDHYDGYGVFGGKDFYQLVAELNEDKLKSPLTDITDTDRLLGINLLCDDENHFKTNAQLKAENIIMPLLIEDLKRWQRFGADALGLEPPSGHNRTKISPYGGQGYHDDNYIRDVTIEDKREIIYLKEGERHREDGPAEVIKSCPPIVPDTMTLFNKVEANSDVNAITDKPIKEIEGWYLEGHQIPTYKVHELFDGKPQVPLSLEDQVSFKLKFG